MTRAGTTYVVIQFVAIAVLLFYSDFRVFNWLAIFQLGALIVAILAGWELNKSRLSVFPELKEGARLIKSGPYRFIRHPMYLAVLLFFVPTVLNGEGILVAVVFLLLLVNLGLKMKYEEKFLKKHFVEYEQYSKKSNYLIPFVY